MNTSDRSMCDAESGAGESTQVNELLHNKATIKTQKLFYSKKAILYAKKHKSAECAAYTDTLFISYYYKLSFIKLFL